MSLETPPPLGVRQWGVCSYTYYPIRLLATLTDALPCSHFTGEKIEAQRDGLPKVTRPGPFMPLSPKRDSQSK